jgi:hypothetical protein
LPNVPDYLLMKIALDVESVLADSNEAALQSTDRLDREELLGEWDLSDHQWQVYMGVTDAVWRHNPHSIPPEEPALSQYVSELREDHEVHILTARMYVDEQVQWWLDEHGIGYESFTSTKQPKHELEYDVFIDDNPDMFGNCRLFLRHQPWNAHLDAVRHSSCERIHSLAEVSEKL